MHSFNCFLIQTLYNNVAEEKKMELKICVPEEMKYICYMCDCQITTKNNLEKHIQSIHEQIKYTGSFCDQQVTMTKILFV